MMIYALFAVAAALFATVMERFGGDGDPPSASARARASELAITIGFAALFQAYTHLMFGVSDAPMMAISALMGAFVARIGVSDARLGLIPDGISVTAFAILPVWAWSAHSGAVPDPMMVAILAASGIGAFLLILGLFMLPFFVFPPVDMLLLLIMFCVPTGPGGYITQGALLFLCFVIRRKYPPFGTLLMRDGDMRRMREDAAGIFGDTGEIAADPSRYFPLTPFGILSMAVYMLLAMLLLTPAG